MSRKRDNRGRFSTNSYARGSDLQMFGSESMRFKKPRGLQPNVNPGQQGRLGSFGRGSNLPPTAAQLGSSARYSSGVIDIQSNSTSSLAVTARPWSPKCCVGDFNPGAVMFVRKDLDHAHYKSVADLPTMNWLFRHSRDALDDLNGKMGAASTNKKGGVFHERGGWCPMGTLRNSFQPPGAVTSLLNVDVWGRTKTSCIWGDDLVSGDRVGYGLVVFDLNKYDTIDGPGMGSRITQSYLDSLTDDAGAVPKTLSARELLLGSDGRDYKAGKQYHVYQWMPMKNGKLAKPVWKYFLADPKVKTNKAPEVDFVDVFTLGCVSNALHSARCGRAHCLAALQSTDKFSTLPQIEIILD